MDALISALERLLHAKKSCSSNLRMITFEADIVCHEIIFDYSHVGFLAKEAEVEIAPAYIKGHPKGEMLVPK